MRKDLIVYCISFGISLIFSTAFNDKLFYRLVLSVVLQKLCQLDDPSV